VVSRPDILSNQLSYAAFDGDLNRCKALLDAGADVNFRDEDGWSAIHGAVSGGHVKVCALLAKRGADLGAMAFNNGQKLTPMQLAVCCEWTDVVDYFVTTHGENLYQTTVDGKSLDALALEVAGGGQGMRAHLLLLRSSSVEDAVVAAIEQVATVEGRAQEPRQSPLELLVSMDPMMQQASNLLCAVSEGDIDTCRVLIAAGADLSDGAQYGSPLHLAAADGKFEICRLLVDAGASLETFDLNDHTPLTRAARSGHVEVCKLLVDAGADPYLSRRADENALTLAYNLGDDEKTCDVLRTLLVKALPDDHKGVTRETAVKSSALRRFAMRGRTAAACQLLIDAGADVNLEDQRGWTSLLLAAANDKLDTCKVLIAAGANPLLAGTCGRATPLTPFQIAVASGATRVASYFVEHHGEDCAQRTANGRTMAQLAGQHVQMKELLKATKVGQSISRSVSDCAGDATPTRHSMAPAL
jgi:ankyrin repeat protein